LNLWTAIIKRYRRREMVEEALVELASWAN
jgi:hypothetical protein